MAKPKVTVVRQERERRYLLKWAHNGNLFFLDGPNEAFVKMKALMILQKVGR